MKGCEGFISREGRGVVQEGIANHFSVILVGISRVGIVEVFRVIVIIVSIDRRLVQGAGAS